MKIHTVPYNGGAPSAPLIHVTIRGRDLVYSPYSHKRLRKVDEPRVPRHIDWLARLLIFLSPHTTR